MTSTVEGRKIGERRGRDPLILSRKTDKRIKPVEYIYSSMSYARKY